MIVWNLSGRQQHLADTAAGQVFTEGFRAQYEVCSLSVFQHLPPFSSSSFLVFSTCLNLTREEICDRDWCLQLLIYRATQQLSVTVRGEADTAMHCFFSLLSHPPFSEKYSKLKIQNSQLWNLHILFIATNSSCFKSINMDLLTLTFYLPVRTNALFRSTWSEHRLKNRDTEHVKDLKLFSIVKCQMANWEKSSLYRSLYVWHPHRCPLQRGQRGLAQVTVVSTSTLHLCCLLALHQNHSTKQSSSVLFQLHFSSLSLPFICLKAKRNSELELAAGTHCSMACRSCARRLSRKHIFQPPPCICHPC